MSRLSSLALRFASLKVTCVLLVAFLLLIFWGVMGQASAGNDGVAIATDRFFNSYILWILGVIPLPAFKGLAVVSTLHLVASMIFRMPKVRGVPGGWRNLGLYGMHAALLVLLLGGVAGSELKREYNGYRAVKVTAAEVPSAQNARAVSPEQTARPETAAQTAREISFFDVTDSLDAHLVNLPDRYPYFIYYKGQVDMFGVQVDMYTATYDPLKFVPYAFMALFLLSMVFHYVARVRHKPLKNSTVPMLLLAVMGLAWAPAAHADELLDLTVAIPDSVGARMLENPLDPVIVNGAVRPFDSFARGVLDEFRGRVTYKTDDGHKHTAADVLYLVQRSPYGAPCAADFKLFKVLRGDVLSALRLPETSRYVSYNDLNASRSQLEIYASRNDDHPATAEMKRLLANVQLFESIQRGDFRKAEASPEQQRKFRVEVFYNHANFALFSFILAFLGCVLAAVNTIFRKRALNAVANGASAVTALVLVAAFVLRSYIAARPPLSSLYEIVLLVAFLLEAFVFGACLLKKNRSFTLMVPVTAMAAVLLFFAKFVLEPGDLFQPVPAVLNSSVFLTLHVFTIAMGFAGVILSGVVAHLYLFRLRRLPNTAGENASQDSRASNLAPLLYGTLVFGSGFTILGTLLGGVWADYAWGRFWGFDPKECGALFVILWTMLGLHLKRGKLLDERGFALFNAFNVIVTFLCWFGINLLGVGLHSYGFQNGTALWLGAFVAVDTAIVLFLRRGRA